MVLEVVVVIDSFTLWLNAALLPSNRHYRNNDDCLEGKRENYPVCSAIIVHSAMHKQFSGLGFVSLGPFHCA